MVNQCYYIGNNDFYYIQVHQLNDNKIAEFKNNCHGSVQYYIGHVSRPRHIKIFYEQI